MRSYHYLYPTRGLEIFLNGFVLLMALVRFFAQIVQQYTLELRMKVRFRLFNQENCQIIIFGVNELNYDHCDVQEVGIPEARGRELHRVDLRVSKLHSH